jgi:hypothetical protein
MLAMPGLRAFSLAAKRGSEGVSCDANGVFVGGVPLLQPPSTGTPYWTARGAAELNKELSVRYRLPIEIASKAGSLGLITAALNRGDVAMAAIAAVQMQIPDPPPLAKAVESPGDLARRASDLRRSRLLKVWEPEEHPRTGTPPNPGWFAPKSGASEGPVYAEMDEPDREDPERRFHPVESIGGGGGFAPGGSQPELPLQEGSSNPPNPGEAPARPSSPDATPRRSWTLPDPKSKLPFMGETEPQLAPYTDGKTSGILRTQNLPPIELQSGYDGPALNMPEESSGFDGYTLSHVEGHAAALMRQLGIQEAWLEINNPEICDSCRELLKTMLPPGAILHVKLPNGSEELFEGATR